MVSIFLRYWHAQNLIGRRDKYWIEHKSCLVTIVNKEKEFECGRFDLMLNVGD